MQESRNHAKKKTISGGLNHRDRRWPSLDISGASFGQKFDLFRSFGQRQRVLANLETSITRSEASNGQKSSLRYPWGSIFLPWDNLGTQKFQILDPYFDPKYPYFGPKYRPKIWKFGFQDGEKETKMTPTGTEGMIFGPIGSILGHFLVLTEI